MKFWNFSAQGEGRGELTLYGDISDVSWWGDEITPQTFKHELDGLGEISQLDIYINSGGGDVFAGETIYNMLKRHPAHKTVHVDGLAASIASVIAMAGDEIIMPENALFMIHEAWTYTMGNKRELADMISTLERIDKSIAGIYAARTGKDEADIAAKMEAETWFTASEALEYGFATKVEENKKVAASLRNGALNLGDCRFELSRYRNPPQNIDPSNGAQEQPVEEINNGDDPEDVDRLRALEAQRAKFTATRRKIVETYEKER